MGFGPSMARLALRRTQLDLTAAAQWLLDETHVEEAIMYESKVEMMETAAGGISRALAEHALETFAGDRDVALAWLTDPNNAAEVARLEASYATSSTMETDAPTGGEAMEVDNVPGLDESQESITKSSMDQETSTKEEAGADDLVLLDLVNAVPSSLLGRLATLLTRVEDLSHVLAWGRLKPAGDNGQQPSDSAMDTGEQSQPEASIVLVELPRLKLTFKPQMRDSQLRLYLVDHSGWFVSDRYAISKEELAKGLGREKKELKDLLLGIGASIILENGAEEVQVLVANQDTFRPKVGGEPWSTMLVFDRASLGWQQAMETRYYLYPLHISRTFLSPPTLASMLYLILLRLLNRSYTQVSTCVLIHMPNMATPHLFS